MSQRLNDIVAVMDMDGFTVNKKFYCKEMGLLKVGDIAARSFFLTSVYAGMIFRRKTEDRVIISELLYTSFRLTCAGHESIPNFGFGSNCGEFLPRH